MDFLVNYPDPMDARFKIVALTRRGVAFLDRLLQVVNFRVSAER